MSTSLGGFRGNTGANIGSRSSDKVGGYKVGRLQNFTPEQMQLFQQLFSHVSPESYTGRLASGDESLFNEIEAPAFRKFSALQGNLASRFSGMGMGARKSSGFQNTANQAASDFSQDLMSRRQELQRQAIMDLMGMSSNLLGQKPYEQFLLPKKQTFLQQLLGGGGEFLGNLGKFGSLFL